MYKHNWILWAICCLENKDDWSKICKYTFSSLIEKRREKKSSKNDFEPVIYIHKITPFDQWSNLKKLKVTHRYTEISDLKLIWLSLKQQILKWNYGGWLIVNYCPISISLIYLIKIYLVYLIRAFNHIQSPLSFPLWIFYEMTA